MEETFSSVNGNRTKSTVNLITPNNGFLGDDITTATNAGIYRFGQKGELQFDFRTGPTQWLDGNSVFFEVRDFLCASATNGVCDANTPISRSWNHVSALFSNMIIELNDVQVENIALLSETDSAVKKASYSQSFLDSFGMVQNLQSYATRITDAQSTIYRSFLWHPDASSVFTHQRIPPNCKVRVRLQPNPQYQYRAVESQNAVNPSIVGGPANATYPVLGAGVLIAGVANVSNNTPANIQFKYGVADIKMYATTVEADCIKPGETYVMDLRPWKLIENQYQGGQDTKTVDIPHTTYMLGFCTTSAYKNGQGATNPAIGPFVDPPTEFRELRTRTDLVSSYQLTYAGQNYPEYVPQMINTTTEKSGFQREFMLSYVANNMNFDDAGTFSYTNWLGSPLFLHPVVKRSDDKSLSCKLQLTSASGLTLNSNYVMIVCQYQKYCSIRYNELGNVEFVKPENV